MSRKGVGVISRVAKEKMGDIKDLTELSFADSLRASEHRKDSNALAMR